MVQYWLYHIVIYIYIIIYIYIYISTQISSGSCIGRIGPNGWYKPEHLMKTCNPAASAGTTNGWSARQQWEYFTKESWEYNMVVIYIYSYGQALCVARKFTGTFPANFMMMMMNMIKIFNECRSLTGVGELNPYWRSSMNVEVSRGWEN